MKIEPPKRPDSFEFAMDFLGDPEAAAVRQYVAALEAHAAEVAALVREECAKLAESFATCPCNGQHGRCMENDPPRSIAAAIREQK